MIYGNKMTVSYVMVISTLPVQKFFMKYFGDEVQMNSVFIDVQSITKRLYKMTSVVRDAIFVTNSGCIIFCETLCCVICYFDDVMDY